MSSDVLTILGHLQTVAAERAARDADASLRARVHAIKAYQQRRFAHTYSDLLGSSRYGSAASFFLEELYGPRDYRERDAQFARVVPAMVKLFPQEIVDTVRTLAQLHALSEVLDTLAAQALPSDVVDAASYIRAWQAVGRPDDREQQIALTLAVGTALDRLTRNPLLRHSLHMMRVPARAAGLSDLQQFLEAGFDTFKAMKGAAGFLDTVATRERALAHALFECQLYDGGHLGDTVLVQLP